MCGIVGIAGPGTVTEAEVVRMGEAIHHRGPDDWGTFVEGGVGLGIRRLSIIDLAGGHQPITNEDESVVIVYNGEIYNHEALRQELLARGHRFRTRTDTEVLVHLYEDHGERMLERVRGMFGFALWDRRRQRLMLARDHFGQKPLFYTESGGRIAFASEIKALLARDPSLATLSPFALDQYLTLRFVQAPETFFERIRALPPAHFLIWENGTTRVERYWDLAYGPKWDYSEAETLERIDALLAETVAIHLTSDVPVGAFLSGGSANVHFSQITVRLKPDTTYQEEVRLKPDTTYDAAGWFDNPSLDVGVERSSDNAAAAPYLHKDPVLAWRRKSIGKRHRRRQRGAGMHVRLVDGIAISIAAIGADPDGCTCANTRRSRRTKMACPGIPI